MKKWTNLIIVVQHKSLPLNLGQNWWKRLVFLKHFISEYVILRTDYFKVFFFKKIKISYSVPLFFINFIYKKLFTGIYFEAVLVHPIENLKDQNFFMYIVAEVNFTGENLYCQTALYFIIYNTANLRFKI